MFGKEVDGIRVYKTLIWSFCCKKLRTCRKETILKISRVFKKLLTVLVMMSILAAISTIPSYAYSINAYSINENYYLFKNDELNSFSDKMVDNEGNIVREIFEDAYIDKLWLINHDNLTNRDSFHLANNVYRANIGTSQDGIARNAQIAEVQGQY